MVIDIFIKILTTTKITLIVLQLLEIILCIGSGKFLTNNVITVIRLNTKQADILNKYKLIQILEGKK